MARKPRPKRRIAHSDSFGKCQIRELASQEVLNEALTRLVPGSTTAILLGFAPHERNANTLTWSVSSYCPSTVSVSTGLTVTGTSCLNMGIVMLLGEH
jgi:hypothetical protein